MESHQRPSTSHWCSRSGSSLSGSRSPIEARYARANRVKAAGFGRIGVESQSRVEKRRPTLERSSTYSARKPPLMQCTTSKCRSRLSRLWLSTLWLRGSARRRPGCSWRRRVRYQPRGFEMRPTFEGRITTSSKPFLAYIRRTYSSSRSLAKNQPRISALRPVSPPPCAHSAAAAGVVEERGSVSTAASAASSRIEFGIIARERARRSGALAAGCGAAPRRA
mmetsp:Transcript_2308/g.6799  ORF Transcript_2308/g.6799 Transcript_2308/m.6799 type:complete len:222 (+) Transcript_2308:374-1039(+)